MCIIALCSSLNTTTFWFLHVCLFSHLTQPWDYICSYSISASPTYQSKFDRNSIGKPLRFVHQHGPRNDGRAGVNNDENGTTNRPIILRRAWKIFWEEDYRANGRIQQCLCSKDSWSFAMNTAAWLRRSSSARVPPAIFFHRTTKIGNSSNRKFEAAEATKVATSCLRTTHGVTFDGHDVKLWFQSRTIAMFNGIVEYFSPTRYVLEHSQVRGLFGGGFEA